MSKRRSFPSFLAVAAFSLAPACGGKDGLITDADSDSVLSSVVGTYDLRTVDEQPLPAPWIPGFTISITAGSIELTAMFRFRMEFVLSTGPAVEEGSYQRVAGSTYRLVNPCGAFTQAGCQQTTYDARLTADSLRVGWGSRALLFVKRPPP